MLQMILKEKNQRNEHLYTGNGGNEKIKLLIDVKNFMGWK